MKKIILAFDGTNFPEAAFEFTRRLNELDPVLLTGVFIPQVLLSNLWSYSSPGGELYIPLMEDDESVMVQQNIVRFEKLCKQNNIEYKVHKDFFDLGFTALAKESSFADLLIVGSEEFYSNMGKAEANVFLEQMLHDIKCPVLLVPQEFTFPENILLSYDGRDESVFAIKQFAYLFPELLNKPALLVYATKNDGEDFPEKNKIEELVKEHFKNLSFHKLVADPKKYFNSWVAENKGAIVVSGAFSRSDLSRFFKKSFINEVITDHKLPVFIAHR